MQLLILIVLAVLGFKATALRWQAFAWIAATSALAVVIQSAMDSGRTNIMGETRGDLFEPQVLAANWAIGAALWAAVYLLGFGAGRLAQRLRKSE